MVLIDRETFSPAEKTLDLEPPCSPSSVTPSPEGKAFSRQCYYDSNEKTLMSRK